MEKHRVNAQAVSQIAEWFRTRGGIAIWRSVNLSNPGASWTCPITGPDGKTAGKPSWQSASTPERVITNPADVEVVSYTESRRFHVATERGSGLVFTLTSASSRKLRLALEKAGKDSIYEFDYERQDAVIMVPGAVTPLLANVNQEHGRSS